VLLTNSKLVITSDASRLVFDYYGEEPLIFYSKWLCSKQGHMMKGSKHEEAAVIFDKLVFTKVQ
jgi:hypothetical protein